MQEGSQHRLGVQAGGCACTWAGRVVMGRLGVPSWPVSTTPALLEVRAAGLHTAGWLCLLRGHGGTEPCTSWLRASPGVTGGCEHVDLCSGSYCWQLTVPPQGSSRAVPADNLLDDSLQERQFQCVVLASRHLSLVGVYFISGSRRMGWECFPQFTNWSKSLPRKHFQFHALAQFQTRMGLLEY